MIYAGFPIILCLIAVAVAWSIGYRCQLCRDTGVIEFEGEDRKPELCDCATGEELREAVNDQ